MDVQIKADGLPSAKQLRLHARRRIQAALDRFAHVVQSVTVRLADRNGPQGGASKLCRIVVQMKSRSVVMEGIGADMLRLIDHLIGRLQDRMASDAGKLLASEFPLHGRSKGVSGPGV